MPAVRISRSTIVEPTLAVPIAAKPQLSLATPHDIGFTSPFEFSESAFASSFMHSTVLEEFSPLSSIPPMTSPLDYLPPSSFSDRPSEPSASDNALSSPSANGGAAIKRRKSTGCAFEVDANGERRPERGDEGYVKRPENAFILFRRKCVEEHHAQAQQVDAAAAAAPSIVDDAQPRAKKARQADLSKLISQQWRSLSAEERAHWESLAKEKKREHELLHPDYVYRPQRAKRAVVRPSKKGKAIAEEDPEQLEAADGLSFVLPPPSTGPAPARRGRNRSHSTPGGYAGGQTVRVPAVPVPPVPSMPSPTIPEIPITRKFSLDPSSRRIAEPPFDPAGVPRDNVPTTEQRTARFSHDSDTARSATQTGLSPLQVPAQSTCAPELSPTSTSSPAQPFSSPFTPSLEQMQAWYSQSDAFLSAVHPALPPPAMYDAAASWPLDYLTEFGQSELLSNGDFDVNAIVPASVDDHSLPQSCEWDFSSLPLIIDSSEGQDPFGFFHPDSVVPYF